MSGELTVLAAGEWRERQAAHGARVDALTADHRARAGRGLRHPVEDFLFSYYALRPAQLRRWYPGAGFALTGADERAGWPFHRMIDLSSGPSVVVDVPAFAVARRTQLDFTVRLLRATAEAPAQFGCFGLHEWAMVFGADRRHQDWPLRLGRSGTDDVVREHQVRCTHYDAFRFFTPQARPLNLVQPDLQSRVRLEQPGCLHASMDVYKWAYKLIPVVPSELLLDCFLLARSIRELDMRASPYDLTELGYRPVPIETAAGKAEYVAAQREFAAAGQALRRRLLQLLACLDASDCRADQRSRSGIRRQDSR